jgi:predicted transcriptional regulator YdeE
MPRSRYVEELGARWPDPNFHEAPGTGCYAVFTHHGHVSTLHTTWDAIWHEWLPRSGYRMANTPEFERYDERFDPRTGSGTIEVWCSIQVP